MAMCVKAFDSFFYCLNGALIGLLLSGCASSQSKLDAANHPLGMPQSSSAEGSPADFDRLQNQTKAAVNPNTVQPGYLWEITSPSDQAINGKFRVDFNGKLQLAYGIVIDSTHLTDSEMRAKIIEAFKPYLKSPERTRVVLSQRKIWIDVRGLVNKPGRYLVESDESLDSILAQAGGVTANSQAEYIQIQQKSGPKALSLSDYYDTGNAALLPPFEGGAVFFVQRKNDISAALAASSHPVVQMFGEVRNPGEVAYRPNADFLYYLTQVGGPSSVADLEKVELIRWVNGKRQSVVFDWDESHQLTRLEPEDLIVIHSNQPTRFERTLQSGAAFAAILSAIGILVIAF
jgi:protein involved in polysaccharide export with SLBB domain